MAHSADAATIGQAVSLTNQNVQEVHQNATEDLAVQMRRWASEYPALFATDVVTQRTVRNWMVPLQYELARITAGVLASTQEQASATAQIVHRSLQAAAGADLRGELATGQAADIIALFNDVWVAATPPPS